MARIAPGRRLLMLLVLVPLLAAACGSRRSYDELLAGETAPAGATIGGGGVATSVVAVGGGAEAGVVPANGAAQTAVVTTPSTTARLGPAPVPAGPADAAGGGPAGEGTAAAPACTGAKAPIVLGSVGTQSGVIGAVISPSTTAVRAWVASVNAKGGIHCHPVKYLVADDGGDPARHQALVRQIVEQNKVVAFLQMNSSLTGQASLAYLNGKQIPVIGSEGASNWFYESPMYFPATSSGDPVIEAVISVAATTARTSGKSKIGVISCLEAQICSRGDSIVAGYVAKYSVELAYRVETSLVQPDYSAVCRSAKDAGVEVLVTFLDGNSLQRLGRSCKSIDFHPIYVVQALTMTPPVASDPNFDHLVGAAVTAPWVLTSQPAVAEHLQALARYAPGVAPGAATMQGWVAAKLFEAATADVDDPTTSAAILEGLWRVRGNDLGGLTYPITFDKGANASKAFCAWPMLIVNGKYTSAGIDDRTCAGL